MEITQTGRIIHEVNAKWLYVGLYALAYRTFCFHSSKRNSQWGLASTSVSNFRKRTSMILDTASFNLMDRNKDNFTIQIPQA